MQKGGYVYILATPNRRSLYTGVTSNLFKRIWEHRNLVDGNCYTARYNCVMLVYYCRFNSIEDAIAEEKRIKGGKRRQKEQLIESMNYGWRDLWVDIENSF
ncbi:MAG TPA: GIY-YIG nuclease family protein [Flavipsychrobacter sp.]|nr:GIY-YIG nuclease family protein [Flavipsychrobacter sp.]